MLLNRLGQHSFNLVAPTSDHLAILMRWFTSESELRQWGGPGFRYPFDQQSFESDLRMASLATFSLLNNEGQLVGFGQYYLRLGRCHLGRLAVSPDSRGLGIIQPLITALLNKGLIELEVTDASLFVFEDNQSAIKAYHKAGFRVTEYPDSMPMDDCLYMIKTPS